MKLIEQGAACGLAPTERRVWSTDGQNGVLTFTRSDGPAYRAELRNATFSPSGLGGAGTGAGTGTFTLDADLLVDCTP
jgi:hypothetical protein